MNRPIPEGDYRILVLDAYDTYKVHPHHRDDPKESRKMNMRCRILHAVPTNSLFSKYQKGQDSPLVEMREETIARDACAGTEFNTAVDFNVRKSDGSRYAHAPWMIDKTLSYLIAISGDRIEDPELMEDYFMEVKDGKRIYDMTLMADNVPLNATALIGREFFGRIDRSWRKAGKVHGALNRILYMPVSDEDQPAPVLPEGIERQGSLFDEEDPASDRIIARYANPRRSKFDSHDTSGIYSPRTARYT